MRAAVGGKLAVDERKKRLAVTRIAVRETKFQRLAGVMQWRIKRFRAVRFQVFPHQIHQAVSRLENFWFRRGVRFQNQLQAGVEIAVMAQPPLDVLETKLAVLENFRVTLELDERAVRLLRFAGIFLFQLTDFERRLGKFTVAMAADKKVFRQRIHRLRADAVQADAELKNVVIIFRAGIYF